MAAWCHRKRGKRDGDAGKFDEDAGGGHSRRRMHSQGHRQSLCQPTPPDVGACRDGEMHGVDAQGTSRKRRPGLSNGRRNGSSSGRQHAAKDAKGV